MSTAIVCLVGNIGRDAELTYTPTGTSKCTFSVATSDGKNDHKTTTWWRVTLWGKAGESLCQYLTKGKAVFVNGSVRLNEYQARDGSVKQSLEVNARDVQFVGAREHQTAPPLSTRGAAAPAPFKAEEVDDLDVPF